MSRGGSQTVMESQVRSSDNSARLPLEFHKEKGYRIATSAVAFFLNRPVNNAHCLTQRKQLLPLFCGAFTQHRPTIL